MRRALGILSLAVAVFGLGYSAWLMAGGDYWFGSLMVVVWLAFLTHRREAR